MTEAKIELPEPAGHVIAMGGEDGHWISDRTADGALLRGADVYTAEQLREAVMRERGRGIRLGDYINAAQINASDVPHVVVQKLQAAIDAAIRKG